MSEARIEEKARQWLTKVDALETTEWRRGYVLDGMQHVDALLQRVSQLEEENYSLSILETHHGTLLSEKEGENDRLKAENQRLRATLEKREEHLAEVRRGAEWFPDSGDVAERRIPPAGAAF